MSAFFVFTALCVFLSQLCEDTADAIEDEDGEGQEGYRRELAERERSATEERTAKVDYQNLYSCDKGHYKDERLIFDESREDKHPFASGGKGIYDAGENKERVKCGEVVCQRAEILAKRGISQEEHKKRECISAVKQDVREHLA